MMMMKTTASIRNTDRNVAACLLVASLLWAGMILGVSMLATPAKFLAPSLALPVALDVGRHTFEVFGRLEIVWALVLAGLALRPGPARWVRAAVASSCGIVAVQAAWLLPALDLRVETIMAGGMPPKSSLHLLYIALEAAKLAALSAISVGAMRRLRAAAWIGS